MMAHYGTFAIEAQAMEAQRMVVASIPPMHAVRGSHAPRASQRDGRQVLPLVLGPSPLHTTGSPVVECLVCASHRLPA